MRISKEQGLYIVTNIHAFFGKDAEVWLFGSRCDDQKKGGDIDLYVQTSQDDSEIISSKMKFLAAMYKKFGEQKIDVIVHQIQKGHELPIYEHARMTGIKLCL